MIAGLPVRIIGDNGKAGFNAKPKIDFVWWAARAPRHAKKPRPVPGTGRKYAAHTPQPRGVGTRPEDGQARREMAGAKQPAMGDIMVAGA